MGDPITKAAAGAAGNITGGVGGAASNAFDQTCCQSAF
jgi:hypothetical protein